LQVVQRQHEASDQREPDIRKYLQVVQRQREASDQHEPDIHKYLQVVQCQREASDQREPDIHKYLQVVQRQREASDQREPNIRQEAIFVNIFRLFNANVKQVINVSQIFAKIKKQYSSIFSGCSMPT
jgi:uncharacterized protein with NRDE domain